jgi:hypothetical protein
MRVTMTMLRRGGRALRAESQKPLTGDVHTKKFKAGDTWVKVLAFQQTNCAPGMIELYDPKVKECTQGEATMVFAGVERDEDAWVVQEWRIEVSTHSSETPVGKGWLKPERRHSSMDRVG